MASDAESPEGLWGLTQRPKSLETICGHSCRGYHPAPLTGGPFGGVVVTVTVHCPSLVIP